MRDYSTVFFGQGPNANAWGWGPISALDVQRAYFEALKGAGGGKNPPKQPAAPPPKAEKPTLEPLKGSVSVWFWAAPAAPGGGR